MASRAPPRGLWVPFMLGRPLGAPFDAAFQRRIVLAALGPFARDSGPVLEDYPEEAPAIANAEELEGMACPVRFGGDATAATLPAQVLAEVAQLRSWYDVALARRGSTTLGAAGASVEDLVRYLGSWTNGESPAPWRNDVAPANLLRLACEEIKAFYFEADAGQPGVHEQRKSMGADPADTSPADRHRGPVRDCHTGCGAPQRGLDLLHDPARECAPLMTGLELPWDRVHGVARGFTSLPRRSVESADDRYPLGE